MPTNKPSRPCLAAKCPNLVASGYCFDHASLARAYDHSRDRNDSIRQLYKSTRWRRYSKWRLRGHPFCSRCGAPAKVTDHIVPAHVAPERFFDPTNHTALCVSCNVRKGKKLGNASAAMKRAGDL